MKTVEIKVPNGYELKEVSEDKWELVKSNITLDDILVKSHQYKKSYVCTDSDTFVISYKNESLVERLEALSKLQCVADYLNDGWKPIYNNDEEKWQIKWVGVGRYKIKVECYCSYCSTYGEVKFKTKELAERTIEICGDNLIKKALGV